MHNGKDDPAPGRRVRLIVPRLATPAVVGPAFAPAFATGAGATEPNPARNGFPIARVTAAVFGPDWHLADLREPRNPDGIGGRARNPDVERSPNVQTIGMVRDMLDVRNVQLKANLLGLEK